MDEELRDLVAQWKKVEVEDMNLMKRTTRLHRFEDACLAGWWILCGLELVATAVLGYWIVTGTVRAAPTPMYALAVLGASALVLVVALTASTRQLRREKERVSDRPVELVSHLIRLRERELYWWTDRVPVVAAFVFAGLIEVSALIGWWWSSATGAASGLFQAVALAYPPWLLLCAVYALRYRIPFLREKVRELERLRAELGEAEAG